jgi:hypothetical protein
MSQQQNETQQSGSPSTTPPTREPNAVYAEKIRNANVSDVNEDHPSVAVLASFCEITYYTVHGIPTQTVRVMQ